MMKQIFWVFLLSAMLSCSEKTTDTIETKNIPELVVVDSLMIDRLTKPSLVDVKTDHSEYLFYDWKTSEFLRISPNGEILESANLTGDGKNSMQAGYFVAARYGKDNELLIQTISGTYVYDLDFSLKEKWENNYELVTRTVGGSPGFDTNGDILYTFSIEVSDRQETLKKEDYSIAYPFITLRDIETYEVLKSEFIPKGSQLAKKPGYYAKLDPLVQFDANKLYLLFPNSPELYEYQLPELTLVDHLDLNPEENYKLIEPAELGSNQEFFKSLAAGEYINFAFSNGYLLTSYYSAAPKEEVEALPKEVIGGKEFMELVDLYKSTPTYQIFKGKEKLWEGNFDIKLNIVRDVIFASYLPGEDPDAVEKDVQTIYFYELR